MRKRKDRRRRCRARRGACRPSTGKKREESGGRGTERTSGEDTGDSLGTVQGGAAAGLDRASRSRRHGSAGTGQNRTACFPPARREKDPQVLLAAASREAFVSSGDCRWEARHSIGTARQGPSGGARGGGARGRDGSAPGASPPSTLRANTGRPDDRKPQRLNPPAPSSRAPRSNRPPNKKARHPFHGSASPHLAPSPRPRFPLPPTLLFG